MCTSPRTVAFPEDSSGADTNANADAGTFDVYLSFRIKVLLVCDWVYIKSLCECCTGNASARKARVWFSVRSSRQPSPNPEVDVIPDPHHPKTATFVIIFLVVVSQQTGHDAFRPSLPYYSLDHNYR
jgi:hypothetical protein